MRTERQYFMDLRGIFGFLIEPLMIRKVTGKPVEMTVRTMCAWAGLHTSDRLLLEAVREVKVVRSSRGSKPAP